MARQENCHGSVAATRFRARPCPRETEALAALSRRVCFCECRLLRRKTMPNTRPMPSVTRFGDHVRLELHSLDPRVATVVLERPERRNAVDRQVADALRAAFETFDADVSLAVAVMSGAGRPVCAVI